MHQVRVNLASDLPTYLIFTYLILLISKHSHVSAVVVTGSSSTPHTPEPPPPPIYDDLNPKNEVSASVSFANLTALAPRRYLQEEEVLRRHAVWAEEGFWDSSLVS